MLGSNFLRLYFVWLCTLGLSSILSYTGVWGLKGTTKKIFKGLSFGLSGLRLGLRAVRFVALG